ncbi:cyclopropane-fatty-acyl-phospholipid synthase domain-containing protein [Rhizobium sp. Kim5]|nr:cyclopropane-fatty-acyl-phospholipid synthase domain-containing protein [Rhizobium sp. Kim5]
MPANQDHVLEIGCGWGGFAEFAAGELDCKVTGLTISREQLAYAEARIEKAGLGDRVKFRFQDYRDEAGLHDRIVSIEMFEAVGEKYWPSYFSKLRQCLKPGGKAGLQIITIRPEAFDQYRSNPDFIQKYVFPGGMLPTRNHLADLAGRVDLSLVRDFSFGLPVRLPNGASASGRSGNASARWVSTSASSASGNSICSIAKPVSGPAISMCARWCSRAADHSAGCGVAGW